jgi:pyruvate/2-oxoglutarate/acetoin dehydrogenase E1 component
MVAEEVKVYLEGPVIRVAQPEVTIACNRVMVKEVSISPQKIIEAVKKAF